MEDGIQVDDTTLEEYGDAQEAQENGATKTVNKDDDGATEAERPSLKLNFGKAAPRTRTRAATVDIVKHQKEVLSPADLKRISRGELLIGFATILLFAIYLLRVLFFPTSNLVSFLVLLPAITASLGMRMVIVNNYSTAVLRLLSKQVNAILLMICVFSIVVICVIESNLSNLIFGLVYAIATIIFVLSDALDKLSRRFILSLSLLFTLATLYQIVGNTFLDWSVNDNVLIDFGKGYIVYKRRLKRSIYLEILCFSLEAFRTIIKNSKGRKFFLFCTGGLYRKSGQSSLDIHFRNSLIQHVYKKSATSLGDLSRSFNTNNKARVRFLIISILSSTCDANILFTY